MGSTCAPREEAYWGPTHTQTEGRSCQTDGLTEGSPGGGSDLTPSLPTTSTATQGPPDATGN